MRRAGWAAAATAFAALLLWAGGARDSAPDRRVVPEAAAAQVAKTPVPPPPRPPPSSATMLRPGRELPHGLAVAVRFDGDWLDVKGTVELPDHALLSVLVVTRRLDLLHGRAECVLTWAQYNTDELQSCEVARRAFRTAVRLAGVGHYSLLVGYSRFAQIDVDVVKSLGIGYEDWSHAVPVIAGDARDIELRLSADAGAGSKLLERLRDALARMQAEIVLDPKVQNWTRIGEALRSIGKDADERLLVMDATRRVILDACLRIEACQPWLPRLNFAVGSVEADHVAAGMLDIPYGVNLEWDVDLAHAYVRRAGECLWRERLLLPLSIASDCWDAALDDPDGQPAVNWQVARDAALALGDDRVRRVIEKMDLATRAGVEARDEARVERDRLVRELSRIPEP